MAEEDWGVNDPVVGPSEDDWGANDPVVEPPMIDREPSAGSSKTMTPQESFLDSTSIGRVLDAFGQGAKRGWGAEPVGLSPESDKALRDIGIFNDVEARYLAPLKSFNEALIRPLAVTGDAALRSIMAGVSSLAEGTGQVVGELGGDAGRAQRETENFTNFALMTAGGPEAAFMGLTPIRPGRVVMKEAPAAARIEPTLGAVPEVPRPVISEIPTIDTPGPKTMLTEAPNIPFLKSEPVTTPVQKLPPNSPIDKAGNINLNRIQAPEDVKGVIREAAQANDEFNFARRGQMTLAETEDMASALGMTPKQLLKRNIGEAWNAEQITAARNLAVQSAVSVRELAGKAKLGSEADLLAFQEALAKHAMIQEQVAGLTAEAGRALSAFRIMSKSDDVAGITDVLTAAGGRETLENLARQIDALDTPQKVSKFILEARKASTMEQIIEAWKAGLLTNPVTHARNVIGNMTVAVWRTAETGVAATIGAGRRALGTPDESVMFGEVGGRITGLLQGAMEGVYTSGKAFKLGGPTDDMAKGTMDARNMRAIPGVAGEIVRTPFKLLAAEDEIFRGIAKRQSINAQAIRKAAREGLTGQKRKSRIVELTQSPTPAMLKRAVEEADYQTFTKKLGGPGQKMQGILDEYPMLRILVPFFRTPVNILKFSGERTVLSVASKEVRSILKGEKGAAARDEQIAKIMVGSSVSAAAATLAAQGFITGGGPSDPAERALLRMTGWQPYSLKIGDMYYSYAGIEPLATLLGISADAVDIAERANADEAENIATSIAYAATTNVASKTMMQGLSSVIEVLQDPERYGEAFANKLAGSTIPSGVAQIARIDDPVLRDARGMIDTIKSRTPGLSDDVYAKRDIWGEPIVRGDSLGPDIVSPIYTSKVSSDPVVQEMLSLGVHPAKLDREIRGVELTAQQYDDYQRIAGRLSKYTLGQVVATPGWADLPAFARREFITKTISQTRETARKYVLMAHPDILAAATQAKIDDMRGGE